MSAAERHGRAVKLGSHLRATSQQLEALAGQLHRATKTLPGRCQLTQLAMDTGKPVEALTVAELLPLVAQVGGP